MLFSSPPSKIPLAFAAAGAKNTIPEASQVGIVPGAASLTDGFPPLTRTPLSAGGVPPSGLDMNGILFEVSAIVRWANAGGGYVYDATFANDANVGGYPKGARLLTADGLGQWLNTVDGNVTDPDAGGAGWVAAPAYGTAAVALASANVTLTPAQYSKQIIVLSGTLTANLNVIFPNTAAEWIVINGTSGGYSVTCKTAAGLGIAAGAVSWIVGDGTNIYTSAASAASLFAQNIASAAGTADALTATFSPAPTSWVAGVPYFVRAAAANATVTPTFTANSGTLAAKTIVKWSNAPLVVGDIAGAGHWLTLQYDATLDKVVLLNPANPVQAIAIVGAAVSLYSFYNLGGF